MTNQTRGLLAAVVKSGDLQIKYIEGVFERLEVHQRNRRKRDLNPLYLVGDLADWTFGEDYIFHRTFSCSWELGILFVGLVSHDHLEQFKDKVQSSMTLINNENMEIHE